MHYALHHCNLAASNIRVLSFASRSIFCRSSLYFVECFFLSGSSKVAEYARQVVCPWLLPSVSCARNCKRCFYQAAVRVSANCVRKAVPNECTGQ